MARRRFVLPDGTDTTSTKKYIKAWRDLAEPVRRALGAYIHGFDPAVTFVIPGRAHGIQLDVDVLNRLNVALDAARSKETK